MKYINLLVVASLLILSGCGANPEASKQRGFELYDLQKFADALPLLEKAFTGGIDDPELVVRLAYCKATVSADGLFALNILRESALKYPNYARTYFELGYVAHQFGSTDGQQNVRQALGFTRKAVQLDSTDYKMRDNLAMYFFTLGELDSAEYWFKAAQALNLEDAKLTAKILQIQELKLRKAAEDSIAALDTLKISLDGKQ
jgi:tetratricopeptide (TPR) repeat protein